VSSHSSTEPVRPGLDKAVVNTEVVPRKRAVKQVIAQYLLKAADNHRFPATVLVPLWTRISVATGRKPHSLLVRLADRLSYSHPVTARLRNGLKMQVYWNDLGVGQHLFRRGVHEQETIGLLRHLVRPGMTVLDIGAQVGQYTLEAAKLVGPTGSVHAFEPVPRNFDLLQANVRINGLTNVAPSPVAISDRNETRTLHLSISRNAGAHSFAPSEISSGETIDVSCTTVDAYVEQRQLRPDLIKLDVEGFELAVLDGARRTLKAVAPLLIIEFNDFDQSLFGRSCRELSARLRHEYGYTLTRIDSPAPMTCSPSGVNTYFNVLAVPSHRLRDVLQALPEPYRTTEPDALYPTWELLRFASPASGGYASN
jgi:FkbM family methyltransferase